MTLGGVGRRAAAASGRSRGSSSNSVLSDDSAAAGRPDFTKGWNLSRFRSDIVYFRGLQTHTVDSKVDTNRDRFHPLDFTTREAATDCGRKPESVDVFSLSFQPEV